MSLTPPMSSFEDENGKVEIEFGSLTGQVKSNGYFQNQSATISTASPIESIRSSPTPALSLSTIPIKPKLAEYLDILGRLYDPSVLAKIWGVAARSLRENDPPLEYPEYTQPRGTKYVSSSVDFWTSGFFPGCLYELYARQRSHPRFFPKSLSQGHLVHPLKLYHACKWWTANLHGQANRKDTHDLGFMIHPWAHKGWEIHRDIDCFSSLITASQSLASRFDPRVGAIRSWDICQTKRYSFKDPKEDFLVIIDNMANLNMLYYVAHHTSNPELAQIATTHALTTITSHIRRDYSTYHVINFDQYASKPGTIKERLTNQGYSDTSCWSRGQAWGILGFVQCYHWTKNPVFLETSQRLAAYFLTHLPEDMVPYWDFDRSGDEPRDSSAALIAVYALLLLHEATGSHTTLFNYLHAALEILRGVVKTSLAPSARFVSPDGNSPGSAETWGRVDLGAGEETIVRNATINNFEYAPRRWSNHGLVYADYFFILVGNKLLEMGIVF